MDQRAAVFQKCIGIIMVGLGALPAAAQAAAAWQFQRVDLSVGLSPYYVATGDLNGDGALDLVTADISANAVSVLLGNGHGHFQAHQDFATAAGPRSVAIGDFNGDGQPDLVTGNGNVPGSISVLGNGDGTFQNHVDYFAGHDTLSVATADFKADGKLDLAVANLDDNTMGVMLGNGDGTFQPQVAYATVLGSNAVAAGRFSGTGPGSADIAAANLGDYNSTTLSVFLNAAATTERLTASPNPVMQGQPVTLTAKVNTTLAGAVSPTGTVAFRSGTTNLGTATLTNGSATVTTSSLPVGNHVVSARYSGDATYNPNVAHVRVQVTP